MRDQAIEIYRYHRSVCDEITDYQERAEREAQAQAQEILKSRNIRKPRNDKPLTALMVADEEEYRRLIESFTGHHARLVFSREWSLAILRNLIIDANLRPQAGDQRLSYSWVYGRYSQPSDAHYERADIELQREQAEELGLRTEVENNYIYAFVADPVDVEIIKMNPLPRKEWVRRCWKKGVNPRVFNPYLPHGFEEANGLDYFGNEVKKG
jgi:hypothetical protein